MAGGFSSPMGIAGLLLIIVGIIMAVVGIILLIENQKKPKGWYIWLLLIGGLIIGITGGILLAFALSTSQKIQNEMIEKQRLETK